MPSNDNGLIKLREAGRRRERDFMALFNAIWYRDFPFIRDHEPKAIRAMFTAHINSVVKACADLMGFFALYEEGNRTDIIIEKASRKNWAKVEIEWKTPIRETVNEFQKLSDAATAGEADVYIIITYADNRKLKENVAAIERQWRHSDVCLLVFLLTFDINGRRRKLTTLQSYIVRSGKAVKKREQYALPWDVPETRWQ